MKIAFVCDDEHTISAHFGHAPTVIVVTVEDGQAVAREVRDKAHHGGEPHDHEHGHGHSHGHGHHRHGAAEKFAAMTDCQAMIVRGIGGHAFEYAQQQGMQVYVTDHKTVEAGLKAYLDGDLSHDPNRVHDH